jgi:hypothetical protein
MRSANRYPARIIRLSAIRLALCTYPTGSKGAAATIVQSTPGGFGAPMTRFVAMCSTLVPEKRSVWHLWPNKPLQAD